MKDVAAETFSEMTEVAEAYAFPAALVTLS
jgi:hypothetical protein